MTRAELLRTLASVPGGFLLDQTLNRLRSFPLPAPAEQTQCAEAGGEERQSCGQWNR